MLVFATCLAAILSMLSFRYRVVAAGLLLLATATMGLGLYFSPSEIVLYKYLILSKLEIRFAILLGILNILVIFINGAQKRESLHNSILSSFMLLFAIFVLGAKNLIAFFIFIEILSFLAFILPQVSGTKRGIEISSQIGIYNIIISIIFFLGVGLFYFATGGMSFEVINVTESLIYCVAIVFLLTVMIYKTGVAPLNFWVVDLQNGLKAGQLISFFFIYLAPVVYVFISTLQTILGQSLLAFRSSIIVFLAILLPLSSLYGNVMSLAQRELKKAVSFNTIAQMSMLVAVILLDSKGGNVRSLLFHLVITMIIFVAIFSALTDIWPQEKEDKIDLRGVKKYYVKNNFLRIKIFLFLLMLVGAPLSGPIVSRIILFSNLTSDGHLFVMMAFVGSLIIGIISLLRFISEIEIYVDDKRPSSWDRGELISNVVQLILMVVVLILGMFPSIFIK